MNYVPYRSHELVASRRQGTHRRTCSNTLTRRSAPPSSAIRFRLYACPLDYPRGRRKHAPASTKACRPTIMSTSASRALAGRTSSEAPPRPNADVRLQSSPQVARSLNRSAYVAPRGRISMRTRACASIAAGKTKRRRLRTSFLAFASLCSRSSSSSKLAPSGASMTSCRSCRAPCRSAVAPLVSTSSQVMNASSTSLGASAN